MIKAVIPEVIVMFDDERGVNCLDCKLSVWRDNVLICSVPDAKIKCPMTGKSEWCPLIIVKQGK